MTRNLIAAADERRRKSELKKCLKSTYYLAKNYLGFDLLTDWHEARTSYFDTMRDSRYLMWLAPRGHYKTTLVEAEVIRDILEDPNKVHLLTHASGEEVSKNVASIARQFTHNKKLRWLMPDIMPPLYSDSFYKLTPSPQFTIRRDVYNKQPTVRGAQAGKEITGSHINGTIWLDDIVGEKTCKDSTGMADLRDWYRMTVNNVLMHEAGGKLRARGTRWHLDDIWNDFLNSADWTCMVDSCLVDTEGNPDWKGESVLFPLDIIQEKQRQLGPVAFAMQMMNLPLTEEMRAWRQQDEQTCLFEDMPPGVTIVLSDPAPKGAGSVDKANEKKRGGEGDFWAISVVRFVKKKNRLIRYRLESVQSRTWTWDEGIEKCLDMCERWGTKKLCIEEGSQTKGMHQDKANELARKRGLPKPAFIKMKSFNQGKAWRHAQLAGLNSSEELIFVTDLVDEGTQKLELQQCRDFPQCRFDDLMDATALCTDPAVIEVAPKAEKFLPKGPRHSRQSGYKKRTRYVY
ncbi:MAG TPA: hypothetical protein VM223_05640 [Planctomycetota bacterium]|nr:hypothetical protein [Planctomycetota bacterium]